MEDELKKILLIDDDPMTLSNASAMLASKYKVYCATSGPASVDIIETNMPDMIILDYEMPGFDGAVTYEFLKDYPGMDNVPIVFMTGASDAGSVKKLLELQPAGYILKPATKAQLIEAVDHVFQKRVDN